MLTPTDQPVAIYARYSTDRQDARSIDDQVRRCRAHASGHGLHVVAEYKDAAISGAHVDRADIQRLLGAARAKGGAPFRAVLVDDLSRLSRDLGNTWQIVFHDLASAGVTVIDVTTGMSSDGAGARLTFGALALVNDTFLQLVRTLTHRGLEGRALAGFATGGRCYGYATVLEENPPDPEHPRKRRVIDPEQAAVVLRIFRLYAGGMSLLRIATKLNDEGVAAPDDGERTDKRAPGWGHTSIRWLLGNERYIGRVTWNQSKKVRVPGRRAYRRVARPKSEWVTREYPDLAIVPRALWDEVQARFKRVQTAPKGRPVATGKHVHLITGLLRCGACGGSMTVIGRKEKNGVVCSRFGCKTHYSRGAVICPNAMAVTEKKASQALVHALKKNLDSSEVIERFVKKFNERVAAIRAERSVDTGDVDRHVRDCERRIANLTEALAKVGYSEALAVKLRDEEAQLGKLKAARAAAVKVDATQNVAPHPATIASYLKNLYTLLETDPLRGREVLSRFVSPIIMTPETEGSARRYRATGAFNISFLLVQESRVSGRQPGARPRWPTGGSTASPARSRG